MRGHAKASSARSTEGNAKGRGPKLAFLVGAALLASLVLGVTLGSAAIPAVTVEDAGEVKYTTAKVTGTVDPQGQFTTYRFQYISEAQFQDNLTNSQPGFEGAATGIESSTETAGGVSGELTGLHPDTVYHLRLVAENGDGPAEAVAASTFETLEVEDPIVSIDPVTTFTGTTAHFSGTVDPNAPSGSLDAATKAAYKTRWDFQCTPACPDISGGFVGAEEGSKAVSADATGLEPSTSYEVKLVARNASGPQTAGPQSFQTETVGPAAETLPAFAIQGGTKALAGGSINPKNSDTTYWIEYGTTTAYGKSIPATKNASAGSAGKAQVFIQKITGLAPSTEYHFRLVAENSGDETQGHDLNFETAPAGPAPESCTNNTLRSENNSTELPDCRAYEQVSPVDKNGYGISYSMVASEDGSAAALESTGGFGDARAAQTVNSYLARRGSGGWTTHGLDPAQTPRAFTEWPHFLWYSPDLRYTMLVNPPNASIAPGDNPTEFNLYLRDNLTDTFHTLSLESPVGVAGSDPSTPPIFFTYSKALTPGAVEGEQNVYEWDDGQVQLVSIGTDGNPIPGGASLVAAIEANGSSTVVFQNGFQGQLYLRKDGQTVRISASQRATPDPAAAYVHFEGASADGSKIFFTGTEALTEDAQLGGNSKLYRYDATTNTLTDLSASALGQELVEAVTAVSADGSYVYFRGNSRFHAGENESGESALYLWHNGTITFIGSDPGSGLAATQANATTYRISPSGRRLSFMTSSRMTSYDNTDSVPGGGGEPRQDSEVYAYDADLNRLTCVSCNPSGQRPTGAPGGGADGGSGFPIPPVDQLKNLQPGVMDDGRIFFNSRDALVPEDVNGKEDVYEWEDGRVHLISSGTAGTPSTLASSSVSGDDVFINTRAHLVAADRDEILDIYDARSSGGFPRAASASACESLEGCHGPASSGPSFADPASGSLSAAAQLSPSTRRLQAARKACKKKPKKARAKCTANAKKHFTKAGRAH